jgi:hypothetical protein
MTRRLFRQTVITRCFVLTLGAVALFIKPSWVNADDFAQSIAPILQKHCVRCHSGPEPEGGLRLEQAADLAASDHHEALVIPGDPQASPLWQAISGEDPRMPEGGPPLDPTQVAAIAAWIDSGALWPESLKLIPQADDWWSLQPLTSPAPPPLPNEFAPLAKNPVDAFIFAKHQQLGLSPAPEADRVTLIRRLTFDLHGLLPSPAEVDEFTNDSQPRAYERLVDRLLQSPRYGERWARHWLDIVHYGDTHGFDKDKTRPDAWPYRDYVIRALNQDKPYNQFVFEQLAGDTLPGPTHDRIPALGFLAAGPFDWVGHIEVAESTMEGQRVRNLDRDDQVATVMNTFVSTTAQCARCHNHKFDPVTQVDYYRMQAIFAAIDRASRPYDPDPQTTLERSRIQQELASIESTIADFQSDLLQASNGQLATIAAQIDVLNNQSPRQPNRAEFGYHSQIATDPTSAKWIQFDFGAPNTIRDLFLVGCYDDFNQIGAGFGFPVRFTITASNDPGFVSDVQVIASETATDFPNPGIAPVHFSAEQVNARYLRITATQLALRQNDFIFALAEVVVLNDLGENIAPRATLTALDSIEAPPRWQQSNIVDGYFLNAPEKPAYQELASLNAARQKLLDQFLTPERRAERDRLLKRQQSLTQQFATFSSQATVYAGATDFTPQGNFRPTGGSPRPIHLLIRGDEGLPDKSLGALAPGTLVALQHLQHHFDLPAGHHESQRRVALANWILDPQNPLTWRSIVNRVWQYHFGRGIVDSANDFGRMGSLPTHPELLDYLAATFRDSNQSLKDLHRLLVTSHTYRQSSTHRADYASMDGDNNYLWRANRQRLDAESLRDTMLQVSGRLDLTMGGPGFQAFGFKDDHSPHYNYAEHDPDHPQAQRRTIYRFIVRSVPDPFMTTLDCADPTISVPRRSETLTTLQALAMLNNQFVVRMAEHFARRLQDSHEATDEQIRAAYQLALQRPPTAAELEQLTQLAHQHGLANVCRLIFNLNEFAFVD